MDKKTARGAEGVDVGVAIMCSESKAGENERGESREQQVVVEKPPRGRRLKSPLFFIRRMQGGKKTTGQDVNEEDDASSCRSKSKQVTLRPPKAQPKVAPAIRPKSSSTLSSRVKVLWKYRPKMSKTLSSPAGLQTLQTAAGQQQTAPVPVGQTTTSSSSSENLANSLATTTTTTNDDESFLSFSSQTVESNPSSSCSQSCSFADDVTPGFESFSDTDTNTSLSLTQSLLEGACANDDQEGDETQVAETSAVELVRVFCIYLFFIIYHSI